MSLESSDSRVTRFAKKSQRHSSEIVMALVLTLAAAALVIAAVSG